MKSIILASVALLILGACTPADLATGRQLTVEAGARYIDERQERRRAIRQQLYQIEDEVIRKCAERVRGLEATSDMETTLETLEWCFDFLEQSYPDLPTIEAIRKGRELLNNLRKDAS